MLAMIHCDPLSRVSTRGVGVHHCESKVTQYTRRSARGCDIDVLKYISAYIRENPRSPSGGCRCEDRGTVMSRGDEKRWSTTGDMFHTLRQGFCRTRGTLVTLPPRYHRVSLPPFSTRLIRNASFDLSVFLER